MSEREQSQASAWPAILISVVMLAAAAWLVWNKNHAAITHLMMKISYFEAIPMAFITGSNDFLLRIVTVAGNPGAATFKEAWAVMYRAGLPYSILVLAFSIGVALVVRTGAFARAVRRLDADTLVDSSSKTFSAVAPVVGRDITKDTSPQWAPSKRPEDYTNEFGLVIGGKLDREAAMKVLLKDLGKPIDSPDRMTDAWKAVFAVCCEFASGEKKSAEAVVDALNYSAQNKACRPDYSLANALYQKHRNGEIFKREVMYHRYAGTLIMRVLELARAECGVLPSSHFIWVKPNDRATWYAINTLGRKVAFIESAAAFAQFAAEKVARNHKMALMEPCLEEAVDALERDLFKTGTVESLSQNTWS